MNAMLSLANKLYEKNSLTVAEYEKLIVNRNDEVAVFLREKADLVRKEIYGNKIFVRGLIEISNICKNDCYYCGIRAGNKNCNRYRLTADEIIECCKQGYELGFRTFVLQGGEDGFFTDEYLCNLIRKIKANYPDCALTLSLGEREKESYQALFNAGADRYLLRPEAVDDELYSKLHPENMLLSNRLECLRSLKKIGFQVGCGFMVGAPHQTNLHIAKDLKFIEEFSPDMCGIGPFIPHSDTPFADLNAGSVELTCFLLSVIRIIHPKILLPSTTALGTLMEGGREKGILSSANVVMPNLSPEDVRNKYTLYNNKLNTGAESAEKLNELRKRISAIGYEIVCERGDVIK